MFSNCVTENPTCLTINLFQFFQPVIEVFSSSGSISCFQSLTDHEGVASLTKMSFKKNDGVPETVPENTENWE